MYRLAFIGHRPLRAYGSFHNPVRAGIILEKIQQHILSVQAQHQLLRILTTMTIGPSTDAAMLAHAFGIPFDAHLPYPSYAQRWPQNAVVTWSTYVGRAHYSEWVSLDPPAPYKYHKANRKIIDLCDEVYFIWDGHPIGGTYQAVEYAKKLQFKRIEKNGIVKPVIKIHELWNEDWQAQQLQQPQIGGNQYGIYIQQNAANNIHFDGPVVFEQEQPF